MQLTADGRTQDRRLVTGDAILGVRLRATDDRGRVNLTYRLGHVE